MSRGTRWGTLLFGVMLAVGTLAPSAAHAGDDKETWSEPLFPPVNPDASPADNFVLEFLGVIRGENEWRAYRGKYRDFIDQEDFLMMVGRKDLADKLRTSRRTAAILKYGGGAMALVGLVLLWKDTTPGDSHPPAALTAGLLIGGLASYLVSLSIDGRVATPAEAESYADRYNQALKNHLETTPKTGTVAFIPIISQESRGLSLAFTF